MKIRLFNNISDAIYEVLDSRIYKFVKDEGEDYDAAIVRSAKLHDAEFPERLLAIARAGIGTDNIPIDRCSEAGIVVLNTPGSNANSVKELVLCGMMLAGRDIEGSMNWVAAQDKDSDDIASRVEKDKKVFAGREIAGKTLGIIGLGAIGTMVANAAIALDMNVIGYDPYLSVESALKLNRAVRIAKTKDELLKAADFVTIHIHLTDETRNTIGDKEIRMMKNDAVVLNYARGGLVDDEAVVQALNEGRLGHYCTDFPNQAILGCDKVTATTHIGASTPEAEENSATIAARHLDTYLRYGNIKNSVNFPDCDLWFESGYRLCIINRNITNMVGQISAALAGCDMNIEHMLNRSKGEWAYTIIDTSSRPDDATVEAIKAIDGVVRVRVIEG